MKAARLEDGALFVRDLPVPVPADGEALIHIRAAGVCHSDLHLARGDWSGVPRTGTIGHEAIGVVAALGPGAERFVDVGDRVILGLGGTGGGYWCGACEYCLGGEPRHCAQSKGIMGTFAEYFSVFAQSLVKLPDSVGDHEAPLACGGLTAYGAVKKMLRHHVLPGRPIAIIGAAGGLGHYAVQIATAFGYKVVGIDIGEERLEFVRSLGAYMAVGADDALEVVQRELGGVDASLVFSAKMAGFGLGMKLLRRSGLFVAVGLPPTSEGNIELNPFEFFMKDPTIIYSAVGWSISPPRAR
jgi:propanol-preferring alcohol dehydrogenase